MQKTIRYEKIPEFDESTQCVVQLEPVETETEIYYGIKIVDLEQQNIIYEEPRYEALPEVIEQKIPKTIEDRVSEIETTTEELTEIVSNILGV